MVNKKIVDSFKHEKKDGYYICNQCGDKIISEPRCVTWGGTFDRKIEDPNKLDYEIDYMFLGQNPWFNNKKNKENVYGRAFGDKSEKILIDYLTQHEFDFSKIWITNVVQCSVLNNDSSLVLNAFEYCKQYLLLEIQLVKPKVIVLLGNVASNLFMLLKKEEQLNAAIKKIYHPNAISYNSNLKEEYHTQFEELKELKELME
jgi:DNA polymerase